MKNFKFLLPILLFFLAIGCNKNNEATITAYFSSSDISVAADTTWYDVKIYANSVDWTITKDDESTWLNVSGDTKGSDDGVLILTFPMNRDTIDREATFTLQYYHDSLTTKTMTFTQLAEEKAINIKLDTMFVSYSQQVVDVDLYTNVEWDTDFDWSSLVVAPWANALNSGTTKLFVDQTLQIAIDENSSSNFRVANVEIKQPNMDLDTTFVLYQAGLGTIESDKAVLMQLYNDTDGANWTNSWDLTAPIESWYGVTIGEREGKERVISLKLGDNNLVGTIPSNIGDISYLEELSLQENGLIGEIPVGIGGLYKLQFLYLFANQLSGEIPVEIFKIPSLARIHLGANLLTGEIPEEVANLEWLKVFGVENNNLTGSLPESLGETTTVQYIFVQGNRLSGDIPDSYKVNDLWLDWDYPVNICPQQSGYGFDNCN